MEYSSYKEAMKGYPKDSDYIAIKRSDGKYIVLSPNKTSTGDYITSKFNLEKSGKGASGYLYHDPDNPSEEYIIDNNGAAYLKTAYPTISSIDVKTGQKMNTKYSNKKGQDFYSYKGQMVLNGKGDKNQSKKETPQSQSTGFEGKQLTFGETYAIPPEYVNALAQMSLGQKGNNQFKRQIIAGTSTGQPNSGESNTNSASNFLGAILQGATEGIADQAQKWSSSETGKADFWNRIVPALESATGRKITALSPEQRNVLNNKYIELQKQKYDLGKDVTDEDLRKVYSDALIEGQQKGLVENDLQGYIQERYNKLKQLSDEQNRISNELTSIQNTALGNIGGQTILNTDNPDVIAQTEINNRTPLNVQKLNMQEIMQDQRYEDAIKKMEKELALRDYYKKQNPLNNDPYVEMFKDLSNKNK